MALNVALIKQLRDRTGAGMTDCKKALEETNNDIEAACDWLREKGIAKAAKKSGRIAAEGTTYVLTSGNDAVILEVNSETDFVAKSDAFKDLVKEVANILLDKKPANVEEAKEVTKELFTNATVKIGEKLDLRRFEILHKEDNQTFGSYIHMGGKISALLVLNGDNAEAAQGIAMHIAANRPTYLTTNDIPAEAVAQETAIQMEASKQDEKLANKPANVLENIIKGKVSKYFAESVLVEQDYLLEPGTKVGAYLKNHSLSIVKFVRFETGEGLEKRVENFAEEVQKQMQ
ncbi:MAG: translation elongation factor Ts [Bacilli bacterium]